MQLFRFELGLLGGPFRERLLVRLFEEHLLQQLRMIEAFRIALQKSDGRDGALFRVQFARFLKLQERRHEKRSGRIDDYDALTFFECASEMDTFDRCANQDRDCGQEPKSRKAIFVDENANWI